ncbi:myo-inositol 2-dehydrogenase/D-chiro-inositol 1-dehydrogenase [Geodermatophilus bullaregiensis]|uniref:Gfo/Idh/MocA family protein n=1 Tax=Geodermatophilus bullaregiensis TaxID=1564160 RepID=UPI0019581B04|nr:Gfo/Idh/MocA family oxidoreductase [Geodermatophilus bullaregiensis]MBM7804994.1 myo-inositol 2-dehydrogenase/D-chiro-inositol 1-dehydrogenase [Geodermatophilus bullaregiensis]
MTTAETSAGVLPAMAEVPAAELRVAVLGVGMMGADHVARLYSRISGVSVVSVSDAFTEKAEQVAAAVPGCRVVGDPLAAIADDDVDAVLIATPGQYHQEQVLACIERGKPVLCEKPLTMDAGSSLALVRAEDEYAARTGRRLVTVGFMRRFDPEYAELKALLDAGGLGEPLLVHCAHRNAAVPPHFTSEMMVSDSVVHEVDVARFLLDEEIAAVTVLRPRATRHAVAGQSDPLLVLFETTGGRMVDVECFVSTGVGYEVRTEVVGEDGSAMIGLDQSLVRQAGGASGATRSTSIAPDFRQRFGRAYDIELQRWVDAARRGEIDGPGAWDGYAAQAVCAAGVDALRTGRRTPVRLADREEVVR